MARLDQHDVTRPQFLLQQLIGSVDVLDPGRPLAIRPQPLGPTVDRLRPLADGNHSRHVQAHREWTEGLMFGDGSGPQLTHLAQNGPGPAILADEAQALERGAHRVRVCVVGVIDDRDAYNANPDSMRAALKT